MNSTDGPYVPAQVWLEEFLGPYVAEVLAGRRWNGWACPRFSREQAQDIAARNAEHGAWTWDDDVLVHTIPGEWLGLQDDEVERFEPDADGKYAVGAFSWVWDSAHHLTLIDSLSTLGECSCGAGWMGGRDQVLDLWRSHLAGR